jgi:hypothetical protein
MTSPWGALDQATGSNKLYLDPAAIPEIEKTLDPYESSLQTMINDRLDDTKDFFGTADNPLAMLLQNAFNARGTQLTQYLTTQLSQTQDFIKTARDAAAAAQAADHR